RPFLAPPGIPEERKAALRQAFDATMKDPAFLAEAARQNLVVAAVGGIEGDRFLSGIYVTPRPLVARAAQILALGQERNGERSNVAADSVCSLSPWGGGVGRGVDASLAPVVTPLPVPPPVEVGFTRLRPLNARANPGSPGFAWRRARCGASRAS